MFLVTPAFRSTATSRRSSAPARLARRLAWVLACGLACRPGRSPAPREPAPDPAPRTAQEAPAPRVWGPEEVVAVVDGATIREADVARLSRVASSGPESPPVPREVLVLQLVERQLVTRAAAEIGITTSDDEIDRALTNVAAANGLTLEQLRPAVVESTGLSWEEYRQEVAAQLVELRLVMTSQTWPSASGWGAPQGGSEAWESERMATARTRVVGCLRARAEVSVNDDAVELPENPFAIAATLAGVRLAEDPKLPAAELEAAARAAAAGKPLCDSLAAAEVAMTELYMERGYLDARVRIPWPKTPGTTIVDVETVPGPRYVIGEIEVDQRAAPKAKRVKDQELRRRIAAIAEPGAVASPSKLRAIVDVVEGALGDAGLGPVEVRAERRAGAEGEDVRVSLMVRVGETGA